MSDMDMVERVARAIRDAMGARPWEEMDDPSSSEPTWYRDNAMLVARTAIAALREPTQQQMSSANMRFPPWGGHGEASAPSQADMWRAMIDAALGSEKTTS